MSELYRKRLCFYFLSAAPSLFFLVGIFVPKGSVILLALAGIMAVPCTKKTNWRNLFKLNATWKTIVLFIIFSAISALWSLTPVNTLYKVLPLIAMGLLALIVVNFSMSLIDNELQALKKGIIFGGFLGFILLGLELTGDAVISRFLRTSFTFLRGFQLYCLINSFRATAIFSALIDSKNCSLFVFVFFSYTPNDIISSPMLRWWETWDSNPESTD